MSVKRDLHYIKGTLNHGLVFQPSTQLTLECFVDADWASNVDDRKSTCGYCLYLGGNLVNWSFKKQHVVVRSSTEAENRSLASVATDILWFSSLFSKLQISLIGAPILWCDNINVKSLAHNHVFYSKTKHIKIDLHFLCGLASSNKLDIRYIPTEVQTANIFTKSLAITRFHLLASKLVSNEDQFSLRGV